MDQKLSKHKKDITVFRLRMWKWHSSGESGKLGLPNTSTLSFTHQLQVHCSLWYEGQHLHDHCLIV